ncbi:MAG: thioredoxin domain-containing protein [Pseudomonadota bacterium]
MSKPNVFSPKLDVTTPAALELDRRVVLTSALALSAVGALGLTISATPARAQAVAVTELARTGGLPDIVLGPDDAAVTVIEYASMSCGHCKRFHETVYPELKKKYIDTGKIRFIFREFPLDNRAAAASMLARCLEGDKSYSMINVLFEQQEDWAYVRGDPTPRLFEIANALV